MTDVTKFEQDVEAAFKLFVNAHNNNGGNAFVSIIGAAELIGSLIFVMCREQECNADDLMAEAMEIISTTIEEPQCDFFPYQSEVAN